MTILKEDRVPTDNLWMIVKIIKAPYQNRYRVQLRYSIIKGLISIISLNIVTEQHIADLAQQFKNTPKKEVLLSRATAQASNTNCIALSCNCKKKCTKRCVCIKNSKTYTQYCHKSDFDCSNLPDTALELTETHLVPRADYTNSIKVSFSLECDYDCKLNIVVPYRLLNENELQPQPLRKTRRRRRLRLQETNLYQQRQRQQEPEHKQQAKDPLILLVLLSAAITRW